MKTKIITTVLSLSILLCTNNALAQITSDYDKTVDFTKYKTFTFKGWANDSDQEINQLDRDRIMTAFEKEFTSRNLVRDSINTDMTVTLFVIINPSLFFMNF